MKELEKYEDKTIESLDDAWLNIHMSRYDPDILGLDGILDRINKLNLEIDDLILEVKHIKVCKNVLNRK